MSAKRGRWVTERIDGEPSFLDGSESEAELLDKVVSLYQRTLLSSETALDYLRACGIERRAIEKFRLGFANQTLVRSIPRSNRRLGALIRGKLIERGLLRDSRTGREELEGCITVPLFDSDNRLVQMYGRRIDRQRSEDRGRDIWLGGERLGLFNEAGIVDAGELVITSSVMDALVVWSHGIEHVTSLSGLEASRTRLLEVIAQSNVRRVTLLFRRCPIEGDVATKVAGEIARLGVEVLRGLLPKDQDAQIFVRNTEDPRYRLREVIRGAEWIAGVPSRRGPENAPRPAAGGEALPEAPKPAAEATGAPSDAAEGLVFQFEDRRWRIRGLDDNRARGTLKVNVFATRAEVGFHVDSFDLYGSRQRANFIRAAALELGLDEAVVKKDLGRVLLELEQAQEEMIRKSQAPSTKVVELSDAERTEALELLQDPMLLERVVGAFRVMGIVGERENLIAGYLVAVSRKLTQPLSLVIQSSSAAGKSSLLDAILSTVPPEDRLTYSAMTGQSLYYMGERSLRHRVLSIAEQAGLEKATYAMKLLQSAGQLTIASTGKEASSGRIVSHEYKVEGPVALMITTSKVELDEELLNRCLVLTVDESPEQTKAVHEAQRRAQTLEGLLARDARSGLEKLHQNMQRLLRPVLVVNPFAESINFADRRVRARRDHRKLLSLIEAIALLHQHQRETRRHELPGRVIEYIEATEADVALAQRLMTSIMGTVVDDMAPRTRDLLRELEAYTRARGVAGATFTRREIRDAIGWGDTQLKTHLKRLCEAELVIAHRAPHAKSVAYELAVEGVRAGEGRALVGLRSGGGREVELPKAS